MYLVWDFAKHMRRCSSLHITKPLVVSSELNTCTYMKDINSKINFKHLNLFLLVQVFVIYWSPLQTVYIQIRPDKMSGQTRIQTIWHSDGSLERKSWINYFWKISRWSADGKKSMQNYPECKEFNIVYCLTLLFQFPSSLRSHVWKPALISIITHPCKSISVIAQV